MMSKVKKKKYTVYPIELLYLIIIAALVFGFPSILSHIKSSLFSGNLNIKKMAEIKIDTYDIDKSNQSSDAQADGNSENLDDATYNETLEDLDNEQEMQPKTAFIIDEKVLVKNSKDLECYDINGKKLWTRTLKSLDTDIRKWNDKYVIVDKHTGAIALVNSDDKLEIQKENLGKFESLVVSKNRLFVKLLDQNEILVLDENLEEVNRISEENGDIVKMSTSYNSSELICYNTSISENNLKSFVVIYDENAKILGTLDLGESILFDVFADENINLLCDDKIITYTKNARPVGELASDVIIVDAKIRGKSLYAIVEKSSAEKELVLYSELLEEEKSEKLTDAAKFISLGERRFLVSSDKRITVYDYSFNSIEEINLTVDIKEIDWITKNVFYVATEDRLNIYSTN